ncbi:site-specific DNA-methyltransferase, partial [Salmonella enterica]|nr:site-specific DNA-methyltransferase [Salmonella enterica]EBO9050705.1 site-specific DNA-methyltransferase [Salmonella enterica subsp. enterica serovar Typhimurium]EBT6636517.1 site-specific DNA-methyltransferase [Salmonella enterica]EDY1866741.1 site-specific DNA-methyltransferase [Salmonella enterica subsp. enterica serovar Typhimurium]
GLAAERNNRRWIACDIILEYIRTQAEMFTGFDGFWMNPAIAAVGGGALN